MKVLTQNELQELRAKYGAIRQSPETGIKITRKGFYKARCGLRSEVIFINKHGSLTVHHPWHPEYELFAHHSDGTTNGIHETERDLVAPWPKGKRP
jgi:hypothetical protein